MVQLFEYAFGSTSERKHYQGALPMKLNHNHPPSLRDSVNLETMTVRELGELAELHGLKLLDVLTL